MNNAINLSLIVSASLFFALSGNSVAKDGDGATLYTAKICNTCHGADAKTPTMKTYPKLAGQSEEYLLQQMKDFKSGARTNSQAALMKAMLNSVTEDDMKVLSAYIASLPVK